MSVGQLSVGVGVNTAKAKKNLKSFRGEVKTVGKDVNLASKSFKLLGGSIAAFGTVAALKSAFKSFRTVAADLTEASRAAKRLGVSVGELQKLEYAAGQTGVETDQLRDGMSELLLRTSEAARGTGEAVEALQDLGIAAKSFQRLPTDRKLNRIADAMQRVGNPGDRIRIADQLFGGEAGVKLINLLDQGSEGLNRFGEEAEGLGLVTKQNLDDVKKFTRAMDRLDRSFSRVGRELTI